MDARVTRKTEWKVVLDRVQEDFWFYGLISFLMGILYVFFLYENRAGITYPLFIAGANCGAVFIFRRMKITIKKESWFLIVVSVLLGVSTFRTGDDFIIFVNHIVNFLLMCVLILHQCYEDRNWGIGKYLEALWIYMVTCVRLVCYPVNHMYSFISRKRDERYKSVLQGLLGVCIAVPLLSVLIVLLGQADMVFERMINRFFYSFLNPATLFSVIVKALIATVVVYCMICSACVKNIKEDTVCRRTKEPMIAITCMGLVAVVYLLFSIIQISYVFKGEVMLSEGMTYSEFARQGFFQLVFVASLNYFMVLFCLKYFRKSRILNVMLIVISICTYVMIASAVCRMLLYIGNYDLTYMRVLVLWFLGTLAVLMVGVIAMIYRNNFPLFRYSLVIVSVFYLGFAWMKPDYVIAKYNAEHGAGSQYEDMLYLTRNLSLDAAPIIAGMDIDESVFRYSIVDNRDQLMSRYYNLKIKEQVEYFSWRRYNSSVAKAEEAFRNWK